MRLMYLGPAAFIAASTLALAADPVPEPPAAGIVPQRANTPPAEEQKPNGPALSPPVFDNTEPRVIENAVPSSPQPPASAPVAETPPPVQPAPAPVAPAGPVGAVVTSTVVTSTAAACPSSVCGPFGPPMFGNAPGPGTGVAVPPVPPAYLAGTTGYHGSCCGDNYGNGYGNNYGYGNGPSVNGVHARYPYYSYRRPWYTAGPASANVSIVW